MQSHQRNHHYRDCLYNIRHNTKHKYINLGRLRAQCPLPESDTTDSLIPQSTPEQTREKTPIIRSRANVRLNMLTKPSFHRVTKSNTTHLSHTGWSEHIGTTPACTCVHTHRVDVAAGWAEGNRSLDPVRAPCLASVPHSPTWCRVTRLPSNSTKSHGSFFFDSVKIVTSDLPLYVGVEPMFTWCHGRYTSDTFVHQVEGPLWVVSFGVLGLGVTLQRYTWVTEIWDDLHHQVPNTCGHCQVMKIWLPDNCRVSEIFNRQLQVTQRDWGRNQTVGIEDWWRHDNSIGQ
jgi:hypothetical protein